MPATRGGRATSANGRKLPKAKVRELRLYLLKEECLSDEEACEGLSSLLKFPLSRDLAFSATLYARRPQTASPPWADFIRPHLDGSAEQFDSLLTQTVSAILLFEAGGRRWALTFGYGRSLLRHDVFERDFGLKVVLNAINPENIRSIDCRTIEELTLHTRKQTSRGATFETFGLNVTQDMVGHVAGEPRDARLARRLAGSDGLVAATQIHLNDLPSKCTIFLRTYQSKDYKKHFPFVDYLRAERDPIVTAKLDDQLVLALNSGEFTRMHMAPPEIMDWSRIDGFFYREDQAELETDLGVASFMSSRRGSRVHSAQTLKNTMIGVGHSESGSRERKWTAYRCLVAEIKLDKTLYVLSGGDWFRIEKTLVDKVNREIKRIAAVPGPTLPDYTDTDDGEGGYNARVASSRGLILMDQKCPRVGGTSIEPCDLFSKNLEFIHVKRKTRSATLSHLFAQGVVSATCFLEDAKFRNAVRDIVSRKSTSLAAKILKNKPRASDFTVVYAIVTKKANNWPHSLPFFSRLNLMNATAQLERASYSVSLVCVNDASNSQ